MKQLMIGTMAVLLTVAASSCTKFLQEDSKSAQPVASYFQTLSEAQSAVNNLYGHGSGPGSFFSGNGVYDATYSMNMDTYSGLANNPVYQNQSIGFLLNLTQTGSNCDSYVGNIWSDFYNHIANCNTIIQAVENSTALTTAEQTPLLAAAKFFRALDYYYLVRLFGAVPLVLTPYTSVAGIDVPRTGVDTVYNSIVNDLTWAIDSGALADVPMGSNGNQVSKGTAEVVLSEVYLTMAGYPLQLGNAYYTKALNTANSLLQSGGGYALFTNSGGTTYANKLASNSNDKGSEYLYFQEYNSTIASSPYPEWTLPNTFPTNVPNSNIKVAYTLITTPWVPSTNLLNMYDKNNDIRIQNYQFYHSTFTYQTTQGSSATITFSSCPYRWFDSTALFSTAASGKYCSCYRLADAYLIAAEAANDLGMDPSQYLAPILQRAYRSMPAVPSGQSERNSFILAERYRELAMEGHFWFDLVRTRLYPDADVNNKVTFSSLVGHSNGRGQSFSQTDLLLPLSITQLALDPQLTQNPGYDAP